ncbi:MAG: D-alanyl-D-alanine carboxypeptidase family protein [Pseudomonadota bacterium]
MGLTSRRLSVALLAMLLLVIGSNHGQAAPALVFDIATGDVYHEHEATRLWHPASLTKIMTTYVALRAASQRRIPLDTPLVMSENAAAEPPSKVGLPVGQSIQLGTAIQIIMIKSANDISVAIAEGIAGTEEGFVQMMNSEARRLGMTSTRFANPHGLHDPQQVTTARDMAILSRALLREFPQFHYIYRMPSVVFAGSRLRGHNTLLGRYDGADGLKTGFVCASGFNIVATATRNGRRLGVVIMGSPNASVRHDYATYLLSQAFDSRVSTRLFGFASATRNLNDLRATTQGPANMRPYVCGPRSQRQPVPPTLASYGVTLPDATVIESPDLPVTARANIPMPRPNPLRLSGQLRVTEDVDPRYPLAPEIPLPRSRPLIQ